MGAEGIEPPPPHTAHAVDVPKPWAFILAVAKLGCVDQAVPSQPCVTVVVSLVSITSPPLAIIPNELGEAVDTAVLFIGVITLAPVSVQVEPS